MTRGGIGTSYVPAHREFIQTEPRWIFLDENVPAVRSVEGSPSVGTANGEKLDNGKPGELRRDVGVHLSYHPRKCKYRISNRATPYRYRHFL